jgi:hypothetical protein
VAAQFAPSGPQAAFDAAIRYLVVGVPILLVALALALGLAYYAGLRAERDRPPQAPPPPDALPPWGGERRDSALAGAIVMTAYWLITSLYTFVLNARSGGAGVGDFVSQHLLQGILFIAFGYGFGAMGGRAPAARKLLDRIIVPPEERGRPTDSAPPTQYWEKRTGAGEAPAPVDDANR